MIVEALKEVFSGQRARPKFHDGQVPQRQVKDTAFILPSLATDPKSSTVYLVFNQLLLAVTKIPVFPSCAVETAKVQRAATPAIINATNDIC